MLNITDKRRCGSKVPPHANEIDNRACNTHIYVGDDALIRCAEAYYMTPDGFPVSAMALPLDRSSFEFNWPVQGRKVIILSAGDCSENICELGQALIISGAKEVYASVNDEPVMWAQNRFERTE